MGCGSTQGDPKVNEAGPLWHEQALAPGDFEHSVPRWEPGTPKFTDLSQAHLSGAEQSQPNELVVGELYLVPEPGPHPELLEGQADQQRSEREQRRVCVEDSVDEGAESCSARHCDGGHGKHS